MNRARRGAVARCGSAAWSALVWSRLHSRGKLAITRRRHWRISRQHRSLSLCRRRSMQARRRMPCSTQHRRWQLPQFRRRLSRQWRPAINQWDRRQPRRRIRFSRRYRIASQHHWCHRQLLWHPSRHHNRRSSCRQRMRWPSLRILAARRDRSIPTAATARQRRRCPTHRQQALTVIRCRPPTAPTMSLTDALTIGAARLAVAGADAFHHGDAGTAAADYNKALGIDAKNVDATIGLGEIALQQGSAGAALVHFKKAARLAPKSARVQTLLGEAYLSSGNNPAAAASFKKALQIEPDNSRARDGYNEASSRVPAAKDE